VSLSIGIIVVKKVNSELYTDEYILRCPASQQWAADPSTTTDSGHSADHPRRAYNDTDWSVDHTCWTTNPNCYTDTCLYTQHTHTHTPTHTHTRSYSQTHGLHWHTATQHRHASLNHSVMLVDRLQR